MPWAGTSTKNPAALDVLYINALAAPFTINSMPDATPREFADHGEVGELMSDSADVAEQMLASFPYIGIDHQVLAEQLLQEGAATFVTSWMCRLASIASKHQHLTSAVR